MATDLSQLFQGILTPTTLAAQQQAEDQQAQQIYAHNPAQFELQRSLNKLAEFIPGSRQHTLRTKAVANQQILNSASKHYAESVKNGASAEEAQLAMLDRALNEFSSQGNYESMSALAPMYLALQQRQAQIAELKQKAATGASTENKNNVEANTLPGKVASQVNKDNSVANLNNTKADKLGEGQTAMIVDLVNPAAGPMRALKKADGSVEFTDQNGTLQTRKPGQYKDAPKEKAPGEGKPINPTVVKDIRTLSGVDRQLQSLVAGFKPSYGGYASDKVGDTIVAAKGKGLMKDPDKEAKWWSDAQWLINADRHALFGSALTPTEAAEWDKAAFTKGLKNPEIKARLLTRARIAHDVSSRTAEAYKKGGHNSEAIDALVNDTTPAPAANDGWTVRKK